MALDILTGIPELLITFVRFIAQIITFIAKAITFLPYDIALISASFLMAFLVAKSKILSGIIWFILFLGVLFYILLKVLVPV